MSISSLTQVSTLIGQSSAGDTNKLSSLATIKPSSSSSASVPQNTDELRQSALQLVSDTLAKAYDKLRGQKLSATEQYQAFEPLTAEKVAANILGFIDRRLQLDQADGATDEQLSSRLEAGLAGFKKGFAQAREQLKALDMLSSDVETDIGKTYDLVLSGVDDLRQKYLGQSGANLADKNSSATQSASSQTNKLAAANLFGNSNVILGEGRSFSFAVRTSEGDKVWIRASAESAFAGSTGARAQNQSFSFKVEGDLNEDELAAINNLLVKVNDLAAQFYQGDLQGAWDQAQALNIDDENISGFKLNLRQQLVGQYTANPPAAATQSPRFEQAPLVQALHNPNLQKFVESLGQIFDFAAQFGNPASLIDELAAGVGSLYTSKSEGAGSHSVGSFQAFIRLQIVLGTNFGQVEGINSPVPSVASADSENAASTASDAVSLNEANDTN